MGSACSSSGDKYASSPGSSVSGAVAVKSNGNSAQSQPQQQHQQLRTSILAQATGQAQPGPIATGLTVQLPLDSIQTSATPIVASTHSEWAQQHGLADDAASQAKLHAVQQSLFAHVLDSNEMEALASASMLSTCDIGRRLFTQLHEQAEWLYIVETGEVHLEVASDAARFPDVVAPTITANDTASPRAGHKYNIDISAMCAHAAAMALEDDDDIPSNADLFHLSSPNLGTFLSPLHGRLTLSEQQASTLAAEAEKEAKRAREAREAAAAKKAEDLKRKEKERSERLKQSSDMQFRGMAASILASMMGGEKKPVQRKPKDVNNNPSAPNSPQNATTTLSPPTQPADPAIVTLPPLPSSLFVNAASTEISLQPPSPRSADNSSTNNTTPNLNASLPPIQSPSPVPPSGSNSPRLLPHSPIPPPTSSSPLPPISPAPASAVNLNNGSLARNTPSPRLAAGAGHGHKRSGSSPQLDARQMGHQKQSSGDFRSLAESGSMPSSPHGAEQSTNGTGMLSFPISPANEPSHSGFNFNGNSLVVQQSSAQTSPKNGARALKRRSRVSSDSREVSATTRNPVLSRYTSQDAPADAEGAPESEVPEIAPGVVRTAILTKGQLVGLCGFLSPQQVYLTTAVAHAPTTRLLCVPRAKLVEVLGGKNGKKFSEALGEKLLTVLQSTPWLSLLPPSARVQLASMFQSATVSKGTELFHIGECTSDASAIYFILEGEVSVAVMDEKSKHGKRIIGPGGFVGELSTIVGLCRTGTAVAQTDLQVRFINRRTLIRFFQTLALMPLTLHASRTLLKTYPPLRDEQILEQMGMQGAFARFCLKEYSAENIEFWQTAVRFRKVVLTPAAGGAYTRAQVLTEAALLYTRYISERSLVQINLKEKVRETTSKGLRSGLLTSDTFLKAEEEILHLMVHDNFARFRSSKAFHAAYDELEAPAPAPFPSRWHPPAEEYISINGGPPSPVNKVRETEPPLPQQPWVIDATSRSSNKVTLEVQFVFNPSNSKTEEEILFWPDGYVQEIPPQPKPEVTVDPTAGTNQSIATTAPPSADSKGEQIAGMAATTETEENDNSAEASVLSQAGGGDTSGISSARDETGRAADRTKSLRELREFALSQNVIQQFSGGGTRAAARRAAHRRVTSNSSQNGKLLPPSLDRQESPSSNEASPSPPPPEKAQRAAAPHHQHSNSNASSNPFAAASASSYAFASNASTTHSSGLKKLTKRAREVAKQFKDSPFAASMAPPKESTSKRSTMRRATLRNN